MSEFRCIADEIFNYGITPKKIMLLGLRPEILQVISLAIYIDAFIQILIADFLYSVARSLGSYGLFAWSHYRRSFVQFNEFAIFF